jgi:hypothetical protein
VTRQALLTPESSNYFNLAVVNFSAGARNKMRISPWHLGQILHLADLNGKVCSIIRKETNQSADG